MRILSALLDLILPRDPARESARRATAFDLSKRIDRRDDRTNGIISYLRFADPLVRAAIHELKYHGYKPLARTLAAAVADEFIADIGKRTLVGGEHPITLLPVPLSRKHARERGFNQCELLAHALAGRVGGNVFVVRADIVERVRHTESQTSLPDAGARRENVAGAFSIHNPARAPRGRIIVLDDVTTTGSTLRAVERALREAGARDIMLVAIAR